jgi:hypothetical protein
MEREPGTPDLCHFKNEKVCLPALFCIRGLAQFGIKIQFILSGTRALKYFLVTALERISGFCS